MHRARKAFDAASHSFHAQRQRRLLTVVRHFEADLIMLWGLIALLCLIWVVAVVGKFVIGGAIHLLLLIAFVVLIIQLLSGKRAPL